MTKIGPSLMYAVAVASDGLHYTNVDTKFAYSRLMERHGDRIIGYYNSRVDRDTLLMDVLEEAHEIGLI